MKTKSSATKLTVEEVKHVAKLANLELSDEEDVHYQKQLSDILELVAKLQKIETINIPQTSQVTGEENVFREDEIDETRILTKDQALSNAARTKNGFFVVPKVLD
jgi:aspartyl-tRNA(Asn)/glutamyl-tRNA(Gln) amidotransferase subunit C